MCYGAALPIEFNDLSQDIAAEQSTMAYRAPELFDVKTGITLDEKVDIWVRDGRIYASPFTYIWCIVTRLHTLFPCILPFALREYTDNGTGWLHSNGGYERAIQAPRVCVFAGAEEPHRQHVEGQPSTETRYPQGTIALLV